MSEANEHLSNIKKGVKVKFGLVAQGHIPTIEKMLDKHCSWDEINKEIGWAGGAAQENYTRYLRTQSAEKDKRIEELVSACTELKADLLRRGEKDDDDCIVVNVSSGVWEQFKKALREGEK